ncbi:MAG: methyltransferase domain-containing protein, partial [Pseudomonadales bacterium]|nr:methyltransferase domain-containing protein [Pseudomonadales bacterium]
MSASHALLPESSGKVIDKHAVAVSFSRAANSYDGVANIQRWVINQLLSKIPGNNSFNRVLDIGCGTGHLSQQIAVQYSPKAITGLDIAEGMVKVANEKWLRSPACSESLFEAVCGDAEAMPFSNNEFSIAVSSFALQWCPNLPVVFSEVYRALEPGAKFYFSLPIDGTLKELKRCWDQVDPSNTHVNDFYSLEDLSLAAKEIGFSQQHI